MTTMLDKCAVAGDITQGIDRRGVWTAAITVIGGTSGTAVKLVSSDTVNGGYTDYKTLISAADAETDQYKGFVVDLHGAKKFIKVTGAVMATAVFGDCDHDVKAIAITAGEVPSGADLEDNKTVSIIENGVVEITPSAGKDGMKKVTATVNVSGGGGDFSGFLWLMEEGDLKTYVYTDFEVAPATRPESLYYTVGNDGDTLLKQLIGEQFMDWEYNKVDNHNFTLIGDRDSITFTRIGDSSGTAPVIGGATTLYAWFDGTDTIYTTTPTPNVGDKVVLSSDSSSIIEARQVYSVTEEGITIDDYEEADVYARSGGNDVSLV